MKRAFRLAALGLALGLAACQTPYPPPRVDVEDTAPPVLPAQAAPVPAPASPGSLYRAGAYRPLFETPRARMVGDTITVQIVEQVSASQSSTSSVDKTGSVDAAVTALPGLSTSSFARATANGSATNSFSGEGATQSTNNFSGTITATVVAVLPNGHLRISGEKQIGVNQNVDVLRFSGQVDPTAIQAGNTVSSTQVANVRVEQRGRGAMAEAQAMGWLARFFLNLLPI